MSWRDDERVVRGGLNPHHGGCLAALDRLVAHVERLERDAEISEAVTRKLTSTLRDLRAGTSGPENPEADDG